jgi:molecular chaperone DnaK (HSP70)
LTDEQVDAMVRESFEKAEDDFKARQVREARVEADTILSAVDKAKANDAWLLLSEEERASVDLAVNQLLAVYHADDHKLILDHIAKLDAVTVRLAETMMNSAVQDALKGTRI